MNKVFLKAMAVSLGILASASLEAGLASNSNIFEGASNEATSGRAAIEQQPKRLNAANSGDVTVSSISISPGDFHGPIDAAGQDEVRAIFTYVVNYASGAENGTWSVFLSVRDEKGVVLEDAVDVSPWHEETNDYGDFRLSFTKNGTYTVTLTSDEDPSVTATLPVEVTGIYPRAFRDFKKATSITPGKDYLIVGDGTSRAMSWAISNSTFVSRDVSINNDVITTDDFGVIWELVENGDHTYSFVNRYGDRLYLSANENQTNVSGASESSDYTKWNISYANDEWTIVNAQFDSGSLTNKYLRCNHEKDYDHWRMFDNKTGVAPQLYEVDYDHPHFADLQVAKAGKTKYRVGEKYDAYGLVVDALYSSDATTISYSGFTNLDTKGFTFSTPIGQTLDKAGKIKIELSLNQNGYIHSTSYTITVTDDDYTPTRYTKITNSNVPSDWRGTYLFVYENGQDSVMFDSSLSEDKLFNGGNSYNVTVEDDAIVGTMNIDAGAVKVHRAFDNDGHPYAISIASGRYIQGDNYGAYTRSTPNEDTVAKFSYGEDVKIANALFKYNSGADRFNLTDGRYNFYNTISLFKLDESSVDMSSFVSDFDNATKAVCAADGSTDLGTLTSTWSSLSELFKNQSVDVQGILANTTYVHDGEVKGSLKDIVDRYDYIVNKYDLEDFMDRKEAGSFVAHASSSNALSQEANHSAAPIVAVGSIFFVASSGFLFFLKRKNDAE